MIDDYEYSVTVDDINTILPEITLPSNDIIKSSLVGGTFTNSNASIYLNNSTGSVNNNQLQVVGDANFQGKVSINGVDLIETLEKIEQRLGILHVNPELEQRWQELRQLSERYRELEKEILEKEKIYELLGRNS